MDKFIYSTFYQRIWEWYHYSNGRSILLYLFILVFCCGITYALQETRIYDIKIKHNHEKFNIESYYKNRIEELRYQLETGDKRTPEERAKDRRMRDLFDSWDFDDRPR